MFLIIIVCVLLVFYGMIIQFKKWRIDQQLRGFIVLKDWSILGAGGTFKGVSRAVSTLRLLHRDPDGPRTPIAFWLGPQLFAMISDPEDLKHVFTSPHCFDKPDYFQYFCFNNGLPVVNTGPWKVYRRALNSTFSTGLLNSFIPVFNWNSSALCDQLGGAASDAFFPALVATVMNQLIQTIFVSEYRTNTAEAMQIYNAMLSLEKGFKQRSSNVILSWNAVYRMTAAYQEELKYADIFIAFMSRITEKMRTEDSDVNAMSKRSAEEMNKLTSIQKLWLLLSNGIIDNEDMAHNCYMIFFAGVLTSITSITAVLLMLAIHPQYQERVVEELCSIFETVGQTVTNESLHKMIFTDFVIKEGVRLYPALPVNSRKCTSNVPISNGMLPKHTTLLILQSMVNRDTKYWGSNANEFHPERFYSPNMENVSPYSFLTFGMGRRNCIGSKYAMISMKILLAHLLRRFTFTTDLNMEDLRFHWHFSGFFDNENSLQLQSRIF